MPAGLNLMMTGWSAVWAAAMLSGLAGPAIAVECLRYAPVPVELVGTLERQFVDRPPAEDLFVDPRDVEVEGDPPDSGFGGPPSAGEVSAVPGDKSGAGAPAGATAGSVDPPANAAVPPVDDPLPPPLAGARPAADASMLPPPSVTLTPLEPFGPPVPEVPTAIIPPPVKRPPPPEEIWVVQFTRPVCVLADRDDFVNVSERKVVKAQIIGETLTQKERLALAKKRVLVRGKLLHALMPRHYTAVLIAAEEIVLEQQAIAAMPDFGRRAPLE